MSAPEGPMKRTPLNAIHRQMGAKMVAFGGWDMPVQYRGILEEHKAVRSAAGMFDVSHMGEVEFRGPAALEALQRLTSNDASRLSVGQVQYSALTTAAGTFVDDLTVYKFADDRYVVTVNAANIDKDFAWMRDHTGGNVEVRNLSDETALIAVQGPRALEILEDGFEVYVKPQHAAALWNALLEVGTPLGLVPCGLGARDTLRLEAKMALYGNDIDDRHTVLEADLGWILKLEKGEFIGKLPLTKQKAEGIRRKLIGFEMIGRGIARSHYPIVKEGQPIGEVTSGSPAPWLEKNIGLGYVTVEHAAIGTACDIMIRGNPVAARVVSTPFYKRKR
jgi:aminomethyltransferase